MTSLADYLASIRTSLDRIEDAADLEDRPNFEYAFRQLDSIACQLADVYERTTTPAGRIVPPVEVTSRA